MVSRETLGPELFFDLSEVWFSEIFSGIDLPWRLLEPKRKERWIEARIRPNVAPVRREGSLVLQTAELPAEGGVAVVQAGAYLEGGAIELRAGAIIEAGAWVTGPTILGPGTAVRHGAYVRGGVLTGEGAVIGHTSEVKSSILMNKSKAPHFAYVGDTILGNHVNLGAGTKVSNLKINNTEIKVRAFGQKIPTGLRKFGAIVGDGAETGCNSVLNPGVLLGRRCMVYPAIGVPAGYYPENTTLK